MSESAPTVAGLFKAKAVTDDDVARLVRAVLDGATDRMTLVAPGRSRRRGGRHDEG